MNKSEAISPLAKEGRPQNILFDLDGTLVDSVFDLVQALNMCLEEFNRPAVALATIRPLVSEGSVAMLQQGLQISEEHPDFISAYQRFLQIYGEISTCSSHLFAGVENLLGQIEQRGLPWGIVTNKNTALTLPLLENLGLHERAACIVCGDTTAHAKPHPAPLLHACQVLNAPPVNSLYVGDARRDVQAAQAAGIPVLIAAYGYIGEHAELPAWGATGIINTPEEVLDYL